MRGQVVRAGARACLLGLTSLAATAQDATPATSVPTSTFTVLDERPEQDKKSKTGSYMITSCNYGVLRIGDKKMPDRFAALRTELAAIAGAPLDGKTLHVPLFNVYVNQSVGLRKMADENFDGALANAMINRGSSCPREKMDGGWFGGTEVSTLHSPLIVEMRVLIDGQAHDVRVVHSPTTALGGALRKPAELQELDAALRKTVQALATQLQ
jgi:hypothetical protein